MRVCMALCASPAATDSAFLASGFSAHSAWCVYPDPFHTKWPASWIVNQTFTRGLVTEKVCCAERSHSLSKGQIFNDDGVWPPHVSIGDRHMLGRRTKDAPTPTVSTTWHARYTHKVLCSTIGTSSSSLTWLSLVVASLQRQIFSSSLTWLSLGLPRLLMTIVNVQEASAPSPPSPRSQPPSEIFRSFRHRYVNHVYYLFMKEQHNCFLGHFLRVWTWGIWVT